MASWRPACSFENAEVFVDGQRKGTAPLLMELTGGRHLVEVMAFEK